MSARPARLVPLLACALLAACAGPAPPAQTFARPAIPAQWSEAAPASVLVGASWWDLFDDATLSSLVHRAAAGNLDVQLAAARLREARAQAGLAAGAATINFTASYARERESEHAPRPVLPGRDGLVDPSVGFDSLYQAGFDAAWEPDLFGRRRAAGDAARADVEAGALEQDAVLLTVCAEVARNYILLRQLQQQQLIARADVAAQRDMLSLLRARRVGGVATGADIARAAAQLEAQAAQLPLLELDAKKAAHRIGVLLGEPPGTLAAQLQNPGPVPHARGEPAAGLPSELLRRRPDIARAERQVAAASARRDVAVADLFPRISLGGAAGLTSVSAVDLFSSASLFARIGPHVTWPLLRRGQITATIEVRGAQEAQAFVLYRQAILNAFEDVDNALAGIAAARARGAVLANAVREGELALALSNARYRGGMADFRVVIEAQHGLAQARNDLSGGDAALAMATIALFKATGGGWMPQAH